MPTESMDDAACCLLSLSWNISRPAEFASTSRDMVIRREVADTCRTAGLGAKEWAERCGRGTEAQYFPFLQLADAANELSILLLLVTGFVLPDLERSHRRWAEIETLLSRIEGLARVTESFLMETVTQVT